MAAIATMAQNQPIPLPKPKTVASVIPIKFLSCMNSEPPRIAQFTAIRGKKIPNAVDRPCENFSTVI